MKQKITSAHNSTPQGFPAGGYTESTGLRIDWQNGPLGRLEDGTRIQPNGCFVETVIEAALDRLRYYQKSPFECQENSLAIAALNKALEGLNRRTARREEMKKEGTHVV